MNIIDLASSEKQESLEELKKTIDLFYENYFTVIFF